MAGIKLNKKMRSGLTALSAANVTSLKTAAVESVEEVTALSAAASAALATADATAPGVGYVQAEAASAATLANACKAKINILTTENADLRARVVELTALAEELATNVNALQAAIDAL